MASGTSTAGSWNGCATPCGADVRVPFVLVPYLLEGLGPDSVLRLPPDTVHHLRRVLRRRDGDPVEVTDGAGRVAPGVLDDDDVRLDGDVEHVPAPVPAVTVVQAVPKGRALDEVVRTMVELGVATVLPAITDRCESRPTDDRARSVGERLRSVAESALQQARSAHLCDVADPRPLAVTLRDVPSEAIRLAAHPDAVTTLGAHLATVGAERPVAVLIGPEGGLTDDELDQLVAAGWVAVRAGSTVLRSVHAATVLTSAVLALTGRFGDEPGRSGRRT